MSFQKPQSWPVPSRRNISLVLVAAGLLTLVLYATCFDACEGVAGTLAGIDLMYVGGVFLGAVGACLLAGWQLPVLWLLSAGVGAELFLVAYQVRTGEYCPFCLGFGASILALFLLQFRRSQLKILGLALPLGFFFVLVTFAAAPLPGFGASLVKSPSFGSGPTEVRLYTDYFCGPCSRLEPELEGKLLELVRSAKARVVLIDVPLHPSTPLYARYFLSLLRPETEFHQALGYRTLLFKAADKGLATEAELKAWLKGQGVEVEIIQGEQIFDVHNRLLAEDRIRSTPSLVVIQGDRRSLFKGTGGVLEGIEALNRGPAPKGAGRPQGNGSRNLAKSLTVE